MSTVFIVLCALGGLLLLWLLLELAVRIVCDRPVRTDFYGSISREDVQKMQSEVGLCVNAGDTWAHVGWIADPERETYIVSRVLPDGELLWCGGAKTGGFLLQNLTPETSYTVRVCASSGGFDRTVSFITLSKTERTMFRPVQDGGWHAFFRPHKYGNYLNDHTVYQAADGSWHVVGITAFGQGDYTKERSFAHGSSREFPFAEGAAMDELPPVADENRLAWAPFCIRANDRFYLWYSPHQVHCQTSEDGIAWRERPDLAFWPAYPQFRDAMVREVCPGQYLMYATARHGYYSSVDVYQSFDAEHWQFLRCALKTGFGCERAAPQASTESPFSFGFAGGQYLSVTYNNESFFLDALLLPLHVWRKKESYSDTLVFYSDNPYDFGLYRGRKRPSTLAGILRAHAPEFVEKNGDWYMTTCGWPWVASLTKGEAAWAKLRFERVDNRP